ncbi:MAG: PilZ domain-containing protein [Candidatus Omnitrophica bacterium]|nr:PilZ domain-containing protein [Candidatus Omnitrophota bacterium]
MDERRRVTRWQVDIPARIRHAAEEAHFSARVKDLSLKGLNLVSKEKLSTDACVKLQVSLGGSISLKFEAWVCWHKSYGEINCYGLYFTKIDDQTKEGIFRFVRNNHYDEVKKKWFGEDGADETPGANRNCAGVRYCEGGGTMEDKRIFERFTKDLPLRFLSLDSYEEGEVRTQNICAKGLCFSSPIPLKPSTPLELWLGVQDHGEPIYARGQVAWSEVCGPNECKVGVNFEKANLMGLSRVLRTA